MRIACLILLCAALIFGACANDDDSINAPNEYVSDDDDDSQDPDDAGPAFCGVDEQKVESILSQMTLREKIAQQYFVGIQMFPGLNIGDTQRLVKELGVGGVFAQPMTFIGLWPGWTVANSNKIQTWALSRENPIPLLIACDQEGGIPQAVSNLTGGTDTPGNMGLGATFDATAAYSAYNIMGAQLHDLGINNAFSPVAGLQVLPDEPSMYTRCFGEDTLDVSDMTAQAVRGFRDNLVIGTAKHFPSHSTARGDEHDGSVVNVESEQAVRTKYFPPFQAAIDAGVDMIMTTHAQYTAWEQTYPTTFSRTLITDILRTEMEYKGLIISDDINMGSIMGTPWDEHPDVLAFAAGHDMVIDAGADNPMMFGMHPDNEKWANTVQGQIDTVEAAVHDGRLNEDQIDESVRRILRTKMKYCLFENPYRNASEARKSVNTLLQRGEARRLHEKAITLAKNDAALWPLDPFSGQKIHTVSIAWVQSKMYPAAFWGNMSGTSLMNEVKQIVPDSTGDVFDVEPNNWVINYIVNRTQRIAPDVLIIGTYHGSFHAQQIELVNRLTDLGIPTILVALAQPYDFGAFPQIDTMLATYSNRDIALQTAAGALFGFFEPQGRLPVTIPGMFEYGHSALQ
jgi:beta-N-acetylhexosaminidase